MVKKIKPGKYDWNELADTLKSVAHCDRLAIIHLLCNCDCDQLEVKNIYSALHLEQSTTSRHLNVMKKGGLLKREVKNGKTYYGFNAENIAALCLKKILTDRK
ncbi:MAG: helix-turn-helix transcriptional regulator [Bacteroidetes bacterium]|nr:helix-turn-helix transcriptional regulator [Bacteroidota bacterium]